MYSTIVAGVLRTDGGHAVARHAIELAAATGARLHLVTALPGAALDSDEARHARAFLDGMQDRRPGVVVGTHLVADDPPDAILRVARDERADLVVVGNRDTHGLRGALGNVARSVTHRARSAVLVVDSTAS